MEKFKNSKYFVPTLTFIAGVVLTAMVSVTNQPAPSHTKTVTVEKEVFKNEQEWRDLKRTDDEIIGYCGAGFNAVSDMFLSQAKLDAQSLQEGTDYLNNLVDDVQRAGERRLRILDKLGY